ncbi:uncharacterized protein TNCV_2554011 [Trichonephila clavipes]|nr:uncharacterized protein TNCV_2554011 [Trichonephila clavipes]
MRSVDLFIKVSSPNQATALIKLQKLAHLEITVAPHSNLKFSRSVISPADFLNVSTEEIKENMKAQNVCDVRRITIRRDGQMLYTKHLILTFSTPDLPQTVKMAYIRCPRHGVLFCHARRSLAKSNASAARNSISDKCIQCTVGTDNSLDSETPTNPEVIAKSKSNSPSKTKVFAKPPIKSPTPSTKTIIKRTQSNSLRRPKSRRAQRPTLARIPKKISRDFHRKIEQDTLTEDCSEADEALMDIQSSPSTFSSGGGASAAL